MPFSEFPLRNQGKVFNPSNKNPESPINGYHDIFIYFLDTALTRHGWSGTWEELQLLTSSTPSEITSSVFISFVESASIATSVLRCLPEKETLNFKIGNKACSGGSNLGYHPSHLFNYKNLDLSVSRTYFVQKNVLAFSLQFTPEIASLQMSNLKEPILRCIQ